MFKTVERFQTADGELFESEDFALLHIADQCREVLDERLSALVAAGKLTAMGRYQIIMALIPDGKAAYALAQALQKKFTND